MKTLKSQSIRSAGFVLEPSLFTFFVVCGGDKGGGKLETLYSRAIWSAVLFCVETVIFVLVAAALKEARSIKRWIPRAFGRRFLCSGRSSFFSLFVAASKEASSKNALLSDHLVRGKNPEGT